MDAKGRLRWRRNDAIAERLRELHDFLVIGGYDELHARRYQRLAAAIARHPDPIDRLIADARLRELPGVGQSVAGLLRELVETGTCRKMEEWAASTPRSVLELTRVPGIGAKTARRLYREHHIDGLATLGTALEAGWLAAVEGIGPKTIGAIRDHLGLCASRRGEGRDASPERPKRPRQPRSR